MVFGMVIKSLGFVKELWELEEGVLEDGIGVGLDIDRNSGDSSGRKIILGRAKRGEKKLYVEGNGYGGI